MLAQLGDACEALFDSPRIACVPCAMHAAQVCAWPVVLPSLSWRQPTMRPQCVGEGSLPALRALCGSCIVPLWWSFVRTPGSLTPWGVTPREVGTFPALRSAPCLANWTTAPAGVGLTAVTRFLVAAWARAGGRDMPGYWWLGDSPSVTYGCAVLSPSPPWSRWLGDSSSGLGGLRGRRTRELAAGRSHPWPWAFLVSVPGSG